MNGIEINPFRPLWAQLLNLTDKQILEMSQTKQNISPTDEILYECVKRFSTENKTSFYWCAVNALDLLFCENIDYELIKEHLFNKPKDISKEFADSNNASKEFKTILLTGRTAEGKSTLTNHLIERQDAKTGEGPNSQTDKTSLYVSDRSKLNIIDTEGLDGTNHIDKTNQELIHEIHEQVYYLLEIDAKIDAIIVMWCPILNKRSGLVKTILELERVFGENALKSCIVMIQGEWENCGNPGWSLGWTKAAEEATKEINNRFPQIPIIRYDALGSLEDQLEDLMKEIDKVQPYDADEFEKSRRSQFFNLLQGVKIRLLEVKNEREQQTEEIKDSDIREQLREDQTSFVLQYQASMSEALSRREEVVKQKNTVLDKLVSAYLGFATNITYLGFVKIGLGLGLKSSYLVAAGVGGLAGGATIGGIALATFGLYGLYQVGSRFFERRRLNLEQREESESLVETN